MDFSLVDHGSIVLLEPLTEWARLWATDHLPLDAQMMGNAYAIEPRYTQDIVDGFESEGLSYQ